MENAFPSTRILRQDVRIGSCSLQECYKNTAFTRAQLHEIYDEFSLDEETVDGYLRVHTGHGNCAFCFHPEEVFLFMLTKFRTGWTNRDLCDHIFGGSATRWSYGYPAILTHLDRRYRRTISHAKLQDFVDQFPVFHRALNDFFRRSTVRHLNDGGVQVRDGLHHLPFTLIGFVDCTIDRICVPYSGPAGNYIGAPRRPEYAIAQESVYTRYKKIHGIKIETVLLPNGISTIYGPCSARVNDIGLMRNLSGLDQFLYEIQQGQQTIYCVLGDGIYNCNALRCTRSYFKSFAGLPLSADQIFINDHLKSGRQAIEHTYGAVENLFNICSHPRNYRFGTNRPYAQEQLRMCHLISNIYTCLNGNAASSYRKFNIMPPTLHEYLHL